MITELIVLDIDHFTAGDAKHWALWRCYNAGANGWNIWEGARIETLATGRSPRCWFKSRRLR